MLPFYTGIHSDHRGLYIDIDARALFQGKIAELYSQPTRILSSKHPKTVLKYKQELWRQLQEHNIPARSEEIQRRQTGTEEEISRELNSIANTVQTAMLSAEKKFQKPPTPPYSVKLAALNKIISFWKIVKSNLTTGRNVDVELAKILEKIPKPMHHMTVKIGSVNSHIKTAVDNYRKAIPDARELRQEQMQEWAEAAAKQGDKTMAQHMRAMANAEHTKDSFRLLKNVIKPQDRRCIRRLKYPRSMKMEKQH